MRHLSQQQLAMRSGVSQQAISKLETGKSSPSEYTIRQLAEKVIEFIPDTGSKLVFEPLPKDDPKRRKPDITLASELLGWKPCVPLDDGLAKTIAYFRAAKSDLGR